MCTGEMSVGEVFADKRYISKVFRYPDTLAVDCLVTSGESNVYIVVGMEKR